MKRIVERMPSERAGVFAYPIDWGAYDSLPAPLQGKISTWVGKTIKEMLGEEEQTLVSAPAARGHSAWWRHPALAR